MKSRHPRELPAQQAVIHLDPKAKDVGCGGELGEQDLQPAAGDDASASITRNGFAGRRNATFQVCRFWVGMEEMKRSFWADTCWDFFGVAKNVKIAHLVYCR